MVAGEGTVMTSLIIGPGGSPNVDTFPRPLMEWSEELFRGVFEGCQGRGGFREFGLTETDYVVRGEDGEDMKIGGNAQVRAVPVLSAATGTRHAPLSEETCNAIGTANRARGAGTRA